MLVADILKDNKFPKWFTDHPIFKDIKHIKKVFPSIGLSNCEEESNIDNAVNIKKVSKSLLSEIRKNISERIDSLNEFISGKKHSESRIELGKNCVFLLSSINSLLAKHEPFIRVINGKISLRLPTNITVDGKKLPIFRNGESLFRVYNKLNEFLLEGKFARLTQLENLQSFKKFSTENVPDRKYKIVFASDDSNGAWDIATMSMRGVVSCQSWGGDYKHCVIGSVIDPFVGIIYLTSGAKSKDYGTQMIRRCVVRFVINDKTQKPYILLDQMYPNYDSVILKKFNKLIQSKTEDKFEIHYAPMMNQDLFRQTYLPLNSIRKKLRDTNRRGDGATPYDDLDSIQSYQDYKVKNKASNKNNKHIILLEKNITKKVSDFNKNFAAALTAAIDMSDMKEFPHNVQPVIQRLKNIKTKENFNYRYTLPAIANSISTAFVKNIDKKDFMLSNLFIKRVYMNYFNTKSKVINEVKIKLTRDINGQLQLKNKRLTTDGFMNMMNILLPKVNTIMKENFKELLKKRSIEASQDEHLSSKKSH